MNRRMHGRGAASGQSGAVALILVLVVGVALTLTATYALHVAWLELKASGNRMRAAQAAEAADSGLAWALARLNDERPVDAACRPAADGAAFRERYQGTPAMPSCSSIEGAWSCRCPPADGSSADLEADAARQAFALRLSSAASGVTTVESIGCSGAAAACRAPAGAGAPPATHVTRTWADVARIPAIDVRPVAAVTVRGSVQLRGEPTVVHHGIASGGLTLHAGAEADPGDARLIGPPGAPALSTIVGADAALASVDAAQFFASVFRMNRTTWQAQPVARFVTCTTPCDAEVSRRLAPPGSATLLWVDGGLRLDGATELGSPTRPVLLIVDGAVHLRGPARIHGVLYLRSAEWRDEAGATLHGALLAENDLRLSGPTRIEHDGAVIEHLQMCCGTWARVPGSWRDF